MITLSNWMGGAGASKWQCYEYAMELTCLNFYEFLESHHLPFCVV
jgi:hypothetical protein